MEKIYLNIAGFILLFKIHYTDQRFHIENFLDMLKKDYGGFIDNGKQRVDFTFHVHAMGRYIFKINKDKASKDKNFYIKTFHINEKRRTLTMHNPPGSSDFEFVTSTVLDNFLIPQGKSFIIHGSGVRYKNKVYMFEGQSGAGKSTTAQMLKGLCHIMADDSLIIRKINNKFYFFQNVLHDKNFNFKKEKESYLIDKVFFIRKADKCAIEEIKNKNFILDKMLKQVFTYPGKISIQFPMVAEFVNNTDFYYLYIKKDERIFKDFFKKEILKI